MNEIATKFVDWEVPSLEQLKTCKAYLIREKINNKERLDREEKNWVTRQVNDNTYFRDSVPVLGWRFQFRDILKTYLVRQYGQWRECLAVDRTSLTACTYGSIEKIVLLEK